MADVACLGILVADLLGRPIDTLPQRGRLGLVPEMTLQIGGCAANASIDLAKLGVPTAVLGKVGVDGLGDFIVRTLDQSGLDTRGVVRDPVTSTSASMVLVGSDGERTFLHHLGGNAKFRAEEVRWDVVEECRVLLVAGALVMPELDGPPMASVLKHAKDLGKATALDVVWDATGRWMETLGPCLPHCDYFLPSMSEAEQLTGRSNPLDAAKALRDRGVGVVAIKLGAEGSFVLSEDAQVRVPAFPVQPVDGTGAGDAYVAGFLCGLVKGWDLERTARLASAVGSLCVTAIGATAGVRTLAETETFIAAHLA